MRKSRQPDACSCEEDEAETCAGRDLHLRVPVGAAWEGRPHDHVAGGDLVQQRVVVQPIVRLLARP